MSCVGCPVYAGGINYLSFFSRECTNVAPPPPPPPKDFLHGSQIRPLGKSVRILEPQSQAFDHVYTSLEQKILGGVF